VTVVVKLGTSLVADGNGRVRRSLLAARAADVAAIAARGERVCIVSSGAIALGLPLIGAGRRPRATPQLQAASAAGQVRLQLAWEAALRRHGLRAAPVRASAGHLAGPRVPPRRPPQDRLLQDRDLQGEPADDGPADQADRSSRRRSAEGVAGAPAGLAALPWA